ncbi:hypothetical protein M514_03026, partial [Trichuris suis]
MERNRVRIARLVKLSNNCRTARPGMQLSSVKEEVKISQPFALNRHDIISERYPFWVAGEPGTGLTMSTFKQRKGYAFWSVTKMKKLRSTGSIDRLVPLKILGQFSCYTVATRQKPDLGLLLLGSFEVQLTSKFLLKIWDWSSSRTNNETQSRGEEAAKLLRFSVT